jgi:hypothetical protein
MIKINHLYCLLLVSMSLFMGFTADQPKSIEGTWVRKGDNLKIQIGNGRASIIEEGNEKFPCDVSDLFIYKDIRQEKTNLWTCNFLVVTMGSCNTNYETGEIFIDKDGELVIICPGFASKVYAKVKPRYTSSPD